MASGSVAEVKSRLAVADVVGETVQAYLVLKDGAAADPEGIVAFCRTHLAAYKVPRRVAFAECLPIGPSNKVDWRALSFRAQVEAGVMRDR